MHEDIKLTNLSVTSLNRRFLLFFGMLFIPEAIYSIYRRIFHTVQLLIALCNPYWLVRTNVHVCMLYICCMLST